MRNAIDLSQGYGALAARLSQDEEFGTRLGEATITIRLARRAGDRLVPWARVGADDQMNWALSELRVREKWWNPARTPPGDGALVAATKAGWSEWEQAMTPVEVAKDGRIVVEGAELTYSVGCGLFRKAGG
jgi:CRISPR-associated endonuclease/helicase Cas3